MEALCLLTLIPHWDNPTKHVVLGLVDVDLHKFKCFIDVPVWWAEISVCPIFPICDAVSTMDETLLSVPWSLRYEFVLCISQNNTYSGLGELFWLSLSVL